MLMPYYIASLNIEREYYELTGRAAPFEGICFVDTLDLARERQMTFLTEANTERVERQKAADINVIIGNPPYNVGQVNENDNNKIANTMSSTSASARPTPKTQKRPTRTP